MGKLINQTHQRILDRAESLFLTQGYSLVRLRDIADELGMKQAALYYYAPDGKEDLFVQVIERSMGRHRAGMEAAIQEVNGDIGAQMRAVAAWLLSQPPVNVSRLGESDFLAIDPAKAAQLSHLIFDALRLPLTGALEQARQLGVIDLDNCGLAAITFVSVIEMIHADTSPFIVHSKETIINQLIEMFLKGWLKR